MTPGHHLLTTEQQKTGAQRVVDLQATIDLLLNEITTEYNRSDVDQARTFLTTGRMWAMKAATMKPPAQPQ